MRITLPQQNDTWPRVAFVVIKDDTDETIPPMSLMLVQEDPRAQYKVHYAISLEPGAVIPEVANPSVGTIRYPDDTKFLSTATKDLWSQYGDILVNDVDSEFFDKFEAEGDTSGALRVLKSATVNA